MAAFISDGRARRGVGVAMAVMLAACGRSDLLSGNEAVLDVASPDGSAAAAPDAGRSDAATADAWSSDGWVIADDADLPEAWTAGDAFEGDATPGEAGFDAISAEGGAGELCTARGCPSNWWTFGYTASHSGYNAAELGVPPMVSQWAATTAPSASLHPACAEDGRAFVTYDASLGSALMLVAVSIADGSVLWTHDFGALNSVGHPTVVKGTVYVQTNDLRGNANQTTALWALDATSGGVRWAAPFDSQSANFWAPTLGGSAVYINGGTFGGLYGFRVDDGSQLFFDPNLPQCDAWTPAFHAGVLYTYVQGDFVAHDPITGSLLWNNSIRGNFPPYTVKAAAAFDKQEAYVIAPPQLAAMDLVTQDYRWITSAAYDGTPAVASGVVYAISGGDLLAVDASTGTPSFTFVGDKHLSYPPVVATDSLTRAAAATCTRSTLPHMGKPGRRPWAGGSRSHQDDFWWRARMASCTASRCRMRPPSRANADVERSAALVEPAPHLRLATLAVILTTAGCAHGPPAGAAAPLPSTQASDEEKARSFLSDLSQGKWSSAAQRFDVAMAREMPTDRLPSFWQQILAAEGSWIGVDRFSTQRDESATVVVADARFSRRRLRFRVTVARDGRIAGFFRGPVPEDAERIALEVVRALSSGDASAIVGEFDARMRSALPPDKALAVWRSMEAKAGAFRGIEGVFTRAERGLLVAQVMCRMDRATLLTKVVFNADGDVAGLFFSSSEASAEWKPPDYVDVEALDERDVKVGSAPALPGVLTLPKGAQSVPAVVLVHGSGPLDRDETVGGTPSAPALSPREAGGASAE